MPPIPPYIVGLIGLMILWLLYSLVSHSRNPFVLAVGKDGKASTSNMQFLLWTIVVIFSYIVIFVWRTCRHLSLGAALRGQPFRKPCWPRWGLIWSPSWQPKLSGLPASIRGRILQPLQPMPQLLPPQKGPISTKADVPTKDSTAPDATPSDGGYGWRYLVREDDDSLSLPKSQMLAWTVVALVLFLYQVLVMVSAPPTDLRTDPSLPDINSALVVLMGIGQGMYLGKKLLTTSTPAIANLLPPTAPAGRRL